MKSKANALLEGIKEAVNEFKDLDICRKPVILKKGKIYEEAEEPTSILSLFNQGNDIHVSPLNLKPLNNLEIKNISNTKVRKVKSNVKAESIEVSEIDVHHELEDEEEERKEEYLGQSLSLDDLQDNENSQILKSLYVCGISKDLLSQLDFVLNDKEIKTEENAIPELLLAEEGEEEIYTANINNSCEADHKTESIPETYKVDNEKDIENDRKGRENNVKEIEKDSTTEKIEKIKEKDNFEKNIIASEIIDKKDIVTEAFDVDNLTSGDLDASELKIYEGVSTISDLKLSLSDMQEEVDEEIGKEKDKISPPYLPVEESNSSDFSLDWINIIDITINDINHRMILPQNEFKEYRIADKNKINNEMKKQATFMAVDIYDNEKYGNASPYKVANDANNKDIYRDLDSIQFQLEELDRSAAIIDDDIQFSYDVVDKLAEMQISKQSYAFNSLKKEAEKLEGRALVIDSDIETSNLLLDQIEAKINIHTKRKRKNGNNDEDLFAARAIMEMLEIELQNINIKEGNSLTNLSLSRINNVTTPVRSNDFANNKEKKNIIEIKNNNTKMKQEVNNKKKSGDENSVLSKRIREAQLLYRK